MKIQCRYCTCHIDAEKTICTQCGAPLPDLRVPEEYEHMIMRGSGFVGCVSFPNYDTETLRPIIPVGGVIF